jgi:hypothetical protein
VTAHPPIPPSIAERSALRAAGEANVADGVDFYEQGHAICDALEVRDRLTAELARVREQRDELLVVYRAAHAVWDSIPGDYDGPEADAHAAALNALGRALASIDLAIAIEGAQP